MFGWIAAAHQIGGAAAAWGAGLVRTSSGSYLGAFIGAGLVCLIAAGMVPFIGMGRDGSAEPAPAPSSAG